MNLTRIIIWILTLSSCLGFAQNKGYQIEGDSVIFTFDLRDYKIYTDDRNNDKVTLEDQAIDQVTLSGEFNNWSLRGWKLSKSSPHTYRLAKPLTAFDHRVKWEFKYVINGTYWAEPSPAFENISRSQKGKFWLDVYNLNLYPVSPDPDGNTTFKLKGHQDAGEVILCGSFNKWDEHALHMEKTPDGWELTLDLKPGQHTYKFIVDGEWMYDQDNPKKTYNEFGGFNSVVEVTRPVTFQLNNFADAREVFLVGSFNQWDPETTPMKKANSNWEVCLDLTGGKHQYKFVVDGKWITDPENEIKEYDIFGHLNSVIMIK